MKYVSVFDGETDIYYGDGARKERNVYVRGKRSMLAGEWRFGERKRLCALGLARKKSTGPQRLEGRWFCGMTGSGVGVE